MSEVTVTADMVLEVTTIGRERAERIAAYATQRFSGQHWVEAARLVDITDSAARSYEKWLPLLRDRFALPEPPRRAPVVFDGDNSAAGTAGGHQRNHVQRGRISLSCPLCQKDA